MAIKNKSHNLNIISILVLSVSLAVILLIPFKIASYGFLPPDDALRHAAKVVSGKTWDKILILRPGITLDSHPGWHAILTGFYKLSKCNIDALVVFSVVSLFLFFALMPFFFLRNPGSWLLTLLIVFLAGPSIVLRLFLGRPYIFTMAVLVFILFSYKRLEKKPLPWGLFITITLFIAASAWIHCLWHLYALLILCFLISRKWRLSLVTGLSAIIGILLGASLTGHPIQFFIQTIDHSLRSLTANPLTRILATEFLPSGGDAIIVITCVIFMLWLKSQKALEFSDIDNPVFILALTGWILGLKTQRFWLDWGFPALCVWMAIKFDNLISIKLSGFPFRKAVITAVSAVVLFFMVTADVASRWTYNLNIEYLSKDNLRQAQWLPDDGGIIYFADMNLFYQTFYKNPRANWRYILGFEPTMMPDEDLGIYRRIHWNLGVPESYKSWIDKMKPQDRIFIKNPTVNPRQVLSQLQWQKVANNIWVGRLPKR